MENIPVCNLNFAQEGSRPFQYENEDATTSAEAISIAIT